MNLGLKIWSTNLAYLEPAQALFNLDVFQYIELFVVPGSINTVNVWRNVRIPFILHAPHSYSGFNLSLSERFHDNAILMKEVEMFRLALSPAMVIFHPGINGSIEETIRQLQAFKKNGFSQLISIGFVENKPKVGIHGELCVGYEPLTIKEIMESTSMGFCLDFGHAVCTAVSLALDWRLFIGSFLTLKPGIVHLSDGLRDSETDQHLNIGAGNFDLKWFLRQLQPEIPISIETKKASKIDLSDFEQDVVRLRKLI
jgi:deoxyribonuclease IV